MSCNCPECKENREKQKQEELAKQMALKKIKTQKAKGIMVGLGKLREIGCKRKGKYRSLRSFFECMSLPMHVFISQKSDLNTYIDFPVFARPCPKRPRHGFVDSRIIKTQWDLMNLWEKVMKADPEGEMVLGPWYNSVDYNAVYVESGSVSVGVKNDGATSGRNSVSFPVAPCKFPAVFKSISGIKKSDAVYLEAIRPSRSTWKLVQARGGPSVATTSPDYIPDNMTVGEVVKPINDLLKWEKMAASFKPGTVVYGSGHTLASHAAIHCIINKIPFITTFEPKVGDKIKSNQKHKVVISREDFKRGAEAGIRICKRDKSDDSVLVYNMRSLMLFSLSVLHNWAYIKQSDHAGWLLGAASLVFLKLCTALAAGEYRHLNDKNNGRSAIYEATLNGSSSCFKKLPKMFSDFHSKRWSDGYGGIPWANCAWYSFSLWQEITKVHNKTSTNLTDKEISKLVGVINKTTNVAHNNGWWFNKFASNSDLDFVAEYPGLAAFCASEVFYKCNRRVKLIKKIGTMKKSLKPKTPFMVGSDGALHWVQINDASLIESRSQITLRYWNNSTYKLKNIRAGKFEKKALRKKYGRYYEGCRKKLIPISSKGNFKIPGFKEKFNLQKVFDIK